jgi:hypothetical protein
MAPPYPFSNPLAWNRVKLGSYWLPGRARITGLEIEAELQHAKPRGKSGGSDVVTGLKRPDFTIELELVPLSLEGQSRRAAGERVWAEFCRIFDTFLPQKRPTEHDFFPIYHPALQLLHIDFVLVRKIRPPVPEAGKILTAFFDCVAWKPPSGRPATHKPRPAQTPAAGKTATIDLPQKAVIAPELRDRLGRPSRTLEP